MNQFPKRSRKDKKTQPPNNWFLEEDYSIDELKNIRNKIDWVERDLRKVQLLTPKRANSDTRSTY